MQSLPGLQWADYDVRCELERLVELVSEILEMSKSRKKKQNEK